ncbi:MAG: pilus assembly protein PilM [Candidatus Saccharibacteria bacterium]|nr:pilus assembly protein PilM [Candidatus Saccharibacteria bacterium]
MKAFFKTKNIVGISVGINDLSMMVFDRSRRRTRVAGYSAVRLDPERAKTSLENADGYLEERMQELAQAGLTGRIDSNYAFVSIPTTKTFSRTLQLPVSIKKDLNSVIDLEVEQYIPVPKNLLNISYDVINQDEENINIILSASPTAIIDRITDATRSIGLEPILVEPSMNSIARLLINSEKGNLNTLIIDMEVNYTDIAVLDKVIKVNNTIEIGGNDFTTAISRYMSIPLEKAHQLKLLSGFSKSQYQKDITDALQPLMDTILAEVQKMQRYNTERLGGQPIDQILVVGISSNIAGLSDYLTNKLNLPVRIASPWHDFNFGRLPKPKKTSISKFLTVAGASFLNYKEVIND